jgi:hypothetical protein
MRKNFTNFLVLCAVLMSFVVAGCSSVDSPNSPAASQASKSTVYGVASLDSTADGTVAVQDSSIPAQEKTALVSSDGTYTVDVSGLKAPFMLRAKSSDREGNSYTLYSISKNGGRTGINSFSDTAVTVSAEGRDRDVLYEQRDHDETRRIADKYEGVIESLRTVLAPLFALYETSGSMDSDDDDDDGVLRAMLLDVKFTVKDGKVIVTNRQTGGIIFSGLLDDLAAGTFYPENMPAGPGGSTACTYTYDAWSACQSDGMQTRNLLSSSPAGCTGTPVLSQTCTYIPPTPTACTYTYGAWGACLSSGTQIRSLLSSSPAGCTGTPVLTQPCAYVPPVTTCTSFTYSPWGVCQSNNTQTRTVTSSSPAGCTGGTPILTQPCTYVPPVTTCTSFTYSPWGACQSNNTQTRTVTSSSPSGCTGGTPVLSQPCTYVPPACTYTYSAWGTCQSNNTQTRTVTSTSPAGCTGTPVLSQSCTYVPPTPACGSCHSIPPATGQHSFHVNSVGLSCGTCHGTGYSSTTVNSATHMNGVVNIASTPGWNSTTGTCANSCHGTRTW